MRKPTKRTLVGATATALVLAGAVAAVGYWTAGGNGTGTAAVGTNVAITAVQTTVITPLVPGVAAQTISGNFTNTNSSPVYVATVTATIASVTKDSGAVGTCDATDFTLASAVMTVNASVPVGAAQGAWTGATIAFNNKAGVNQDACKLATVALAYAIG